MGAQNTTGNGIVTQTGGTVAFYSDAGVTIGGTGALTLGAVGTGTYTYNLDGGTLTAPSVTHVTGTGVFNFNGGTLKAAGSTSTFMQGLTTANVRNGGAIIDSNTFDVTIGQALLHSGIGGDNATDGGLTKSGNGTLTLGGVNTYTGATAVNVGTLSLTNGNALGTTAAGTTVANGATLALSGGIAVGAEAVSITGVGVGINNGAIRRPRAVTAWLVR